MNLGKAIELLKYEWILTDELFEPEKALAKLKNSIIRITTVSLPMMDYRMCLGLNIKIENNWHANFSSISVSKWSKFISDCSNKKRKKHPALDDQHLLIQKIFWSILNKNQSIPFFNRPQEDKFSNSKKSSFMKVYFRNKLQNNKEKIWFLIFSVKNGGLYRVVGVLMLESLHAIERYQSKSNSI